MSYGKHNNIVIVDGIDQAVRKPSEAATAYALLQSMPSFGMACDAVRGCYRLDQKGVSESWRLRLIPADSLVQLGLGDLNEPDRHERYLATISLKSFAGSSPRR